MKELKIGDKLRKGDEWEWFPDDGAFGPKPWHPIRVDMIGMVLNEGNMVEVAYRRPARTKTERKEERKQMCEEAAQEMADAAIAYFVRAHKERSHSTSIYYDRYMQMMNVSDMLKEEYVDAARRSIGRFVPATLKEEVPESVWKVLK